VSRSPFLSGVGVILTITMQPHFLLRFSIELQDDSSIDFLRLRGDEQRVNEKVGILAVSMKFGLTSYSDIHQGTRRA
jgi:hypothetical protein